MRYPDLSQKHYLDIAKVREDEIDARVRKGQNRFREKDWSRDHRLVGFFDEGGMFADTVVELLSVIDAPEEVEAELLLKSFKNMHRRYADQASSDAFAGKLAAGWEEEILQGENDKNHLIRWLRDAKEKLSLTREDLIGQVDALDQELHDLLGIYLPGDKEWQSLTGRMMFPTPTEYLEICKAHYGDSIGKEVAEMSNGFATLPYPGFKRTAVVAIDTSVDLRDRDNPHAGMKFNVAAGKKAQRLMFHEALHIVTDASQQVESVVKGEKERLRVDAGFRTIYLAKVGDEYVEDRMFIKQSSPADAMDEGTVTFIDVYREIGDVDEAVRALQSGVPYYNSTEYNRLGHATGKVVQDVGIDSLLAHYMKTDRGGWEVAIQTSGATAEYYRTAEEVENKFKRITNHW